MTNTLQITANERSEKLEDYPVYNEAKIGRVKFSNRVMLAPMVTCLAGVQHEVTDILIRHYERIAQGGVGAVIVESTLVNDNEDTMAINELHLSHHKYLPGMTRLAESITSAGSTPVIQLNSHDKYSSDMPEKRIDQIAYEFGVSAKLAKTAGFKAIEIHSCHNNFCCEILSPITNGRSDKYGGSIKKNTRFVAECIRNIKEQAGIGMPVIIRYNGNEYHDDGITPEIAIEMGLYFEEQGADALHITAGRTDESLHIVTPYARPPKRKGERFHKVGWLIEEVAQHIKERVTIPVIGVSRIDSMSAANDYVKNRDIDFVAIGRGLLASPNMVRENTESKCEYVNYCTKRVIGNKPIGCIRNPEIGQ